MLNQRQDALQEQMARERQREEARRQKEEEERRRREEEEWKRKQQATASVSVLRGPDYSRANNWGLPPGFRVNKTAQGRLFFINDSTRQTQWVDPRPLPPGYRSGKTPQGRPFYINDNTKQTSWNDPRPRIMILVGSV